VGVYAFQCSVCDKNKERENEISYAFAKPIFFFDFRPGEVSARHTDFPSILVLLGGIFLSEQDARY
jgi:hypothetical protein